MSADAPASVLSDGTIIELVHAGRIRSIRGTRARPAGERRPAARRLLPRLPQPPRPAIDLRRPARRTSPRRSSSRTARSFVIHPGEFCLGRTLEWVELPDDIVARIEGKSSLGRLGLIVHATAGFCDPGWKGTLTLELNNLTRVPIILYPGLEIAQLSFMTLDRPAPRPYGSPELGSHYQGQRAATASRYRLERRTPARDG